MIGIKDMTSQEIKELASSRGKEIMEKIESRVKDKQILFEGYAPEQSALLKKYVLTDKNGFIFYAVGSESADALRIFISTVK